MSHLLTVETLNATLVLALSTVVAVASVTTVTVATVALVALLLSTVFGLVSRNLAVIAFTGELCLELLLESSVVHVERFGLLVAFFLDELLDVIIMVFLQSLLERSQGISTVPFLLDF